MIVGVALTSVACVDEGGDRAWDLAERRHFVGASSPAPSRDTRRGEFHLVVPLGLDRNRLVLSASDALTFGDGAEVIVTPRETAVAARGPLSLGARTRVTSVYAAGAPARIGEAATIVGYVKSCRALQTGDARVTVGIIQGAACDSDEYVWRVDFPATTLGDRLARAGASRLELAPGAYGNVQAEAASVIRLRSGRYTLDSLELAPESVLEVDNTRGPVFVWIRSKLSMAGTIVDYWTHPSVLFGYAGEVDPVIAAPLRGTWVAPAARLRLPRTAQAHSGAFFAKSIEVEAHARIEHRPFATRLPPSAKPVVPAELCSECAGSTRARAAECCARLQTRRSVAGARSERCLAMCSRAAEPWPGCDIECRLALDMEREDAAREYASCGQSVAVAYAECQTGQGYRPSTCPGIGHGGFDAITCAQ
ncbi:MAG: hypothetical protein ACOY0T_14875 [Myxococcota bacterium]